MGSAVSDAAPCADGLGGTARAVRGLVGTLSTKRFTIVRRLGEGGMGIVYEAFDEERHAPVALKTLNRFDGNALARFKREFRALQGLAHPNLVALDELFFENEQWFFTMELVEGVDFVAHVTGREPTVAFESTVRESVAKLAARAAANGAEVAPCPSFDEHKLRNGLRQLLDGLSALHAADKVHRDIKPSNVLVTPSGRVVLLDFGLVVGSSTEDRSTGDAVVGTPAYMAPEQAASRDLGPAADLYAVGVMLYEVLTGRWPIEGPPLQILLAKQTREPAAPSSIAPGVPPDLDELCMRLLRFDPALRPSVADALQALSVPRVSGATLPRASTETPIFVGRAAELSELRAAFEVTAKGGLATALVCGESGIGKSYLVRRFTGQLVAEHPEAMLLEGRCYERETVPYKTLDAIVDAVSRRLARMTPKEVRALLPARSATLAQLFPVMLRIPQVAAEHAALHADIEPHELRQRAFVALRDLFTRFAVSRPTVVVIDDLQWADDDGLRALAEILRPPDAPPLLLLGTVRIASTGPSAGLERLRAVIPGANRTIDLTALGPDDARSLAAAFLKRTDAPDADPELIASEAGGHPLFVEELARHVALGGLVRHDVKLDDAIWSRVVQLEAPTREMAELVAIAGKPVAQEIVAAAAHVEPVEFNRRAATLRVSTLVRTGGARWADAIEPYHDRVREAVLTRLEPERRRALHEALAIAFEASSHPDPETLATHWRGAGEASRATKYAAAAGDQTAAKFAFDRAAQWYTQALELMPEGHTARRELRAKLGDALASAGRGVLAAAAHEAAAAEAPPFEALELKRRAAEELMKAGRLDQGVALLRDVFSHLHERFPGSSVAVLFWLLVVRAQLWLRGLRFSERDPTTQDRRTLVRINMLWSAGAGYASTDSIRGAYFHTETLLWALRAGDLRQVSRAVAMETLCRAAGGTKMERSTLAHLAIARKLAERVGTPEALATAHAADGVAYYFLGDWSRSIAELVRAEATLRDHCVGVHWEMNSVRLFLYRVLTWAGRFDELQRRHDPVLRDAVQRGDVQTLLNMKCGAAFVVALARNHPADAQQLLDEARKDLPTKSFLLQHHYHLIAQMQLDLYCGRPKKASARLAAALPRIRRSLIWQVPALELLIRDLLARCALACAEAGGSVWLAEARACVKRVRRLRLAVPWAPALATLGDAGVLACEGQQEAAMARLRTAIDELEAQGLAIYAVAARRRLGRIVGGDEGQALVASARAFEAAEGIVDGEAFARLHAPGLGRLDVST